MRLVSVENLQCALSDEGIDGISSMVRVALNLVTPALAECLGTTFDRVELGTEVFFIDPGKKGLQQYPKMLLLSHGMVDPNVEVLLKKYSDEALSDWAYLNCPVSIDHERGVVCPMMNVAQGSWVGVTYSSGLCEVDGTYENVPPWLQKAAIMYGVIVYKRLQAALERKKNGGIAYQVGYLDGIPTEVVRLLKDYMNCMPLAYMAIDR